MAQAFYNRRLYQATSLLVGPSGYQSTGQHLSSGNSGSSLIFPLTRVLTISPTWSVNRVDITEFGQLSPISREINETPKVGLNFTYYAGDGLNEARIGLVTSGVNSSGALTNIITNNFNQNYFIPYVVEGTDLVGQTGNQIVDIRGYGNCYLSNYSVEAAVGGFLTASAAVEGFNVKYDIGQFADTITGNYIPAVDTASGVLDNLWIYQLPADISGYVGQPTVIKQGDLLLDLSQVSALGVVLTGVSAAHIQRFSISMPLGLETLQQLGQRFGYAILPKFPINVTCSISAFTNALNSGNLTTLFCNDNEYTITVHARTQSCTAIPGADLMQYTLKGCRINSQASTLSIGPAETSEIVFETTIGGPTDSVHNFFISGLNGF